MGSVKDGVVYVVPSRLPNGCTLFWRKNEAGGRTYFSDEVGGGVVVWDTALVDDGSLLAALTEERRLNYEEALKRHESRDHSSK